MESINNQYIVYVFDVGMVEPKHDEEDPDVRDAANTIMQMDTGSTVAVTPTDPTPGSSGLAQIGTVTTLVEADTQLTEEPETQLFTLSQKNLYAVSEDEVTFPDKSMFNSYYYYFWNDIGLCSS